MTRATASACVLLAIAGLLSHTPLMAQIYKWTDADGNVHFSDQPPPDDAVGSSEVAISSEQPDAAEQAAVRTQTLRLQSRNEASSRSRAQREVVRKQQRESLQQRERKCAAARAQLAVVERTTRTFRPGPDGERVYMDEATRAARTERIRQAVQRFCN